MNGINARDCVHYVGDDGVVTPVVAKEEINLYARVVKKVQLTKGDWEVLGKNVWIDQSRGLVYFMGLKETPLEKHLYAVSYMKNDYIRILTTRGFSYTVEINDVSTLQ